MSKHINYGQQHQPRYNANKTVDLWFTLGAAAIGLVSGIMIIYAMIRGL